MIDFKFFIKPSTFSVERDQKSLKNKIIVFFICFFVMYFCVFCAGVFQTIIDVSIKNLYGISINKIIMAEQFKSRSGLKLHNVFFFTCLIAPIIEELMNRLPLILNKWNIAVALCLCYLNFIDGYLYYNFTEFNTWLKISLCLITLITFYFIKVKSFHLRNEYNFIYFYTMAIVFALLHLNNFYRELPKELIFVSVLYVLPQFFLGVFAGYLRLKNGILYSFLIHILYNTIAFSLNYFK